MSSNRKTVESLVKIISLLKETTWLNVLSSSSGFHVSSLMLRTWIINLLPLKDEILQLQNGLERTWVLDNIIELLKKLPLRPAKLWNSTLMSNKIITHHVLSKLDLYVWNWKHYITKKFISGNYAIIIIQEINVALIV